MGRWNNFDSSRVAEWDPWMICRCESSDRRGGCHQARAFEVKARTVDLGLNMRHLRHTMQTKSLWNITRILFLFHHNCRDLLLTTRCGAVVRHPQLLYEAKIYKLLGWKRMQIESWWIASKHPVKLGSWTIRSRLILLQTTGLILCPVIPARIPQQAALKLPA